MTNQRRKFARLSAAVFTRSRHLPERPSPLAPKSPPSIPAMNKSGKPCARSISSAAPQTCPRSGLTSANRATSPTASASKPFLLTKPSARAPRRLNDHSYEHRSFCCYHGWPSLPALSFTVEKFFHHRIAPKMFVSTRPLNRCKINHGKRPCGKLRPTKKPLLATFL